MLSYMGIIWKQLDLLISYTPRVSPNMKFHFHALRKALVSRAGYLEYNVCYK